MKIAHKRFVDLKELNEWIKKNLKYGNPIISVQQFDFEYNMKYYHYNLFYWK